MVSLTNIADLSSLGTVGVLIACLMIVLGFALLLFGERIVEAVALVLGAIVGALIGFSLGIIIANIFASVGSTTYLVIVVVFFLLGLVLGAIMAKSVIHGYIAFSAGALAFLLSMSLLSPFDLNPFILLATALVIGLIVFIVVLSVIQKVLCIITALIGAILIGNAIQIILTSYAITTPALTSIISMVSIVILTIVGSIFQLEARRKKKSGKREKKQDTKKYNMERDAYRRSQQQKANGRGRQTRRDYRRR